LRVKSVKYERLFSFEKYNNERIGMEVEISEHDNAEAVLGELYFKILNIEKCLDLFRYLKAKLDIIISSLKSLEKKRKDLLEDIRDTEKELEEIQKIDDIMEKQRRICRLRDIKQLRRDLVEVEEKIENYEELKQETKKALEDLEQLIKAGEFEKALEKYLPLGEKLSEIYGYSYY